MDSVLFDNPEYIIIVGQAGSYEKNSYDFINEFYQGMEMYDYFSGQIFSDRELNQIVDDGYDLVAIYNPITDQVVDYRLSKSFDHWLDCYDVKKEKICNLVGDRFRSIFLKTDNSYKSIFNQLIIGT